ncbi:ScyD/ScyE family protein [Streptomyces sp. NPDC005728]|uniref:ScyD/ScyE family protein n=1 Tax=Streptomyces sp. NPDC005728 TaxID=3157054 RepID=UPI003404C235
MARASTSFAGAFLAAAVVGSLTATIVPAQAATPSGTHTRTTAPAPVVVAGGLHNPRGISIQPDGSVLVAEAGSGPETPCTAPPGVITRCLGFTGSVYRVRHHAQGRVATGLPSQLIYRPDGSSVVTGALQAQNAGHGAYRVVYGMSGLPADRDALGAGSGPLGTLALTSGKVLGDLARHEADHDPDSVTGNKEVFSNPANFARDGRDFLVTDAGANDLIRVHPDGTTTTEFVFPNNTLPAAPATARPLTPAGQAQAVPTGIVRGRDGAFYIADMSALRPGLGRIWRYVPGSAPTVFATGLTDVIDLDVDPRGNLIALSYNTGTSTGLQPGALTRIDRTSGALTPIDTGGRLSVPTGLAVSACGDIYVTNNTLGTSGELLKFPAR